MKFRPLAVLTTGAATMALGVVVIAPAQASATDPVTDLAVTQAQVGSQDKVSATWTPNDSATVYRMSVADNAEGDSPFGFVDVSGGSASLTTGGLVGGATYYVTVQPRQPVVGTLAEKSFTALSLDTEGPNGTYALNRTTGYLAFDFDAPEEDVYETAFFTLTQTGLSDNTTAAGAITRTVTQGDSSAAKAWTSGSPFKLRYTKAGTFTPKVTLTDEFGNQTIETLPAIKVLKDRAAPRVRITTPAVNPSKVASWRRIRGTATDAGTGIDAALAFVVQKRHGIWYAYDFRKNKWLKGYAGLTKTIRKSKANPAQMRVTAAGTWQTKLIKGLRKGPLHVEAVAIDKSFNVGEAPKVNRILK